MLSAVLRAETSAAEDKNHWILSLQFGKLPPFPSMISKFVVWENSSWTMSGRITSFGLHFRRVGECIAKRRFGDWQLLRRFRCNFSTGEQSLNHVERHWNEKNRDARSGNHSANHGRAEHATRDSAGAAGEPKRQASENEGE